MTTLDIKVTRQSDYKSIKIECQDNLDGLTEVIFNFYTTSTVSPVYTYTLTVEELADFIANGEITLTFLQTFGTEYASDNWYIVQLEGSGDDTYTSNYDGFGSDAYITPKVYQNINNLHTPETRKDVIEELLMQVMMLEGMKYLDTSTINSRDNKWKKRFNALVKMNS